MFNPRRKLLQRRESLKALCSCLVLLLSSCSSREGPSRARRAAPPEQAPALLGTALEKQASQTTEPYPLSPEMRLLEADARDPDYPAVLRELKIRFDLDAEWQRIDVPDGVEGFVSRHGGRAAIEQDLELLAALKRREQLQEDFLDIFRAEYRMRRIEPPFDEGPKPTEFQAEKQNVAQENLGLVKITPILPAPGSEKHWPRWRGPDGQGNSVETDLPVHWFDPGDGAAPEVGPDGERPRGILWKTPIPGRGHSSPVIWGDRIFLLTAFEDGARRGMVCVRRDDGKLLWTKDAPAADPENRVYPKTGYAASTPVTDGERVIAFLGSVGLVAYDFQGQILWHRRVGSFGGLHGTAASPVLYNDLVILFQDQGIFRRNRGADENPVYIALDTRSGEVRWQLEGIRPVLGWCTPVVLRVGDRDELIHGSGEAVTAYDPASGSVLWTCRGATTEVVPTIVAGDGVVYSTSGRNGPTLAIRPGGDGDVTDTHLVWRYVRGGPHVPSPALWKDRLYVVNDKGFGTCLNARTGEVVWQKRLRGMYSASPVAADDKIYFTNEDGVTRVLKAGDEGRELAVNELNVQTYASPAILDRTFYFRTFTHLLAIGGEDTVVGSRP
jgi:outer membrane protein assembly factor BamB